MGVSRGKSLGGSGDGGAGYGSGGREPRWGCAETAAGWRRLSSKAAQLLNPIKSIQNAAGRVGSLSVHLTSAASVAAAATEAPHRLLQS